MEIKYNNIIINNKKISFTIKHGMINGIITKNNKNILDILLLNDVKKESIRINNNKPNNNEFIDYKKKIVIIPKEYKDLSFCSTVYERLKYEIRNKNLILKNEEKKIKDSLKIVGLNNNYLDRVIFTLSSREKKLFQFSIALISNPDLLIIEEPFIKFDIKSEKKVWLLLQKIKDNYNKTIVFYSNDMEIMHKYCDHIILIDKSYKVITGTNKEIFSRSEIIKEHDFVIPEIIEFTNITRKEKKVKLDYHKDIRDIIKDIYKHI